MRYTGIILIYILSFFLQSALNLQAQGKSDRAQVVKLQLKWKHQFQFAGYYAAIEKGFYEEAGIHIEFLLPNGHTNPIDVVDKGKADFGITGAGILLSRSKNQEGGGIGFNFPAFSFCISCTSKFGHKLFERP